MCIECDDRKRQRDHQQERDNEIDRFRAENAALKKDLEIERGEYNVTKRMLELSAKENAKLRDALERIEYSCDGLAKETAQKALGTPQKEGRHDA